MTSIRICGESFCGPLNIIFKTCLNTGKFQLELSEYINIYIYTFFLQISQDLDLDLADFPCKRKQGVVLNGQCSCRADVRTGVPLRSIFGTFLLFIYVNDLSDGLINNAVMTFLCFPWFMRLILQRSVLLRTQRKKLTQIFTGK